MDEDEIDTMKSTILRIEGFAKLADSRSIRTKEAVDRIERCLIGSVGNGGLQKGLIQKVDGICDWRKNRVWFDRAVIVAVLGGAVALLLRSLE